MYEFGPKNKLNSFSVFSSYDVYGHNNDQYILDHCEKVENPKNSDWPFLLGYYIDDREEVIVPILIGHGWSGFSNSERAVYKKYSKEYQKFFSEDSWNFSKEFSINLSQVFVSEEDAKTVLNLYFQKKLIEIKQKLSIINTQKNGLSKKNFCYSFGENNKIIVSGSGTFDKELDIVIKKLYEDKLNRDFVKFTENMDELTNRYNTLNGIKNINKNKKKEIIDDNAA